MINQDIMLNNYNAIKNELSKNALSQRITLLAVSKGQSEEKIIFFIDKGHRSFGENKVQEAKAKWQQLKKSYPDVHLHLIGALQTNKAEEAVDIFDVIETVDREKLVDVLSKYQHKKNLYRDYYIQVNIGQEAQKAGVELSELAHLLTYAQQAGLNIVGLMCIPPEGESPAPYFALLHKLAKRYQLSQISMGMSSDYVLAAQLGSTQVRVGTMLFGERQL